MRYHYTPISKTEILKLKISISGKDVEQKGLPFTFHGNTSGIPTLEDSLAVSYKVKHSLTIYCDQLSVYLLN